jgi:hypothetical protein
MQKSAGLEWLIKTENKTKNEFTHAACLAKKIPAIIRPAEKVKGDIRTSFTTCR